MKDLARSWLRRALLLISLVVVACLVWLVWGATDVGERDGSRAAIVDGVVRVPSNDGPADTGRPRDLEEPVSVTVRDLWDGSPIASVAIGVSFGKSRDRWLETDAQGRLTLAQTELSALTAIRTRGSEYRAASKAADVRERKEIWCHSRAFVAGRVAIEGSDGTEFEDVELSYSPARVAPGKATSSDPGLVAWMRKNKAIPTALPGPAADGTFRLELPRIRGAALVARLPGWFPAWQSLRSAFDSPSGGGVLLVLRRGIRLDGVLKDASGVPVANEMVRVYVVVSTSYDEVGGVGRAKQRGYTMVRSRKNNSTKHKLSYGVRTDKDGKWHVDIDTDGEVFVATFPHRKAPVMRALGPASRIADAISLTTRAAPPARVRITRGPQPVANESILFMNYKHYDAKPSFYLKTDGEGYVDGAWLTRGDPYFVFAVASAKHPVYMRYAGQSAIDLDACETDRSRFLGR